MAAKSSTLEDLGPRRVVMCVGPGGVGKTTCTAAIGLAAAHRGRKVAVVTIDPSLRLGQVLGLANGAGNRPGTAVAVDDGFPAGAGLDALLLDAHHVFDDIVRSHSSSPQRAQTILKNPIYQATVQRLGGAVEYAAMARVQMLYSRGEHDLIVLDTPPTANAIDFLEAPGRVREVVTNPAARLLAGSGRIGMKLLGLGGGVFLKTLESMGGGPFVADLGEFLREFSEILSEFQRRAGDFEALLESEETAVVLATAATDFCVREAADFLAVLREHHLTIAGVVLNRVDPPMPPMPDADHLRNVLGRVCEGDVDSIDSIEAGVQAAHDAASREAQASRNAYERLAPQLAPLPVIAVPRQVPPPSSLADLRAIGDGLLG